MAVNGTCLTATFIENGRVGFDVIRESVARSNLGALAIGDLVNVERSLKFGDEIGGHVLSGHVADVVTVAQIDTGPQERTVWFDVPREWLGFLFHKGFVALDGASLTIAAIDRERGSHIGQPDSRDDRTNDAGASGRRRSCESGNRCSDANHRIDGGASAERSGLAPAVARLIESGARNLVESGRLAVQLAKVADDGFQGAIEHL